ncbi:hypothetical protein HMI54_015783 [Coelomomyces lativittatus]|nr:hypothetical protein HMI56_006452 [Coelomomyces lativittatus]KAJ1512332.1 hypothetical protein HMI54_015783 [Coelomomyces lativittatus]KAJ1516559.1 hypothetical protein HMI55_001958 [Coelomomyces lativittatus]
MISRYFYHPINERKLQQLQKRTLFSLIPFKSSILVPSQQPIEYHQRKLIRFPPSQLYDIVTNVDLYSKFVPYCKSSVIHSRRPLLTTLPAFTAFLHGLTRKFTFHPPDALCLASSLRMSATLQVGYFGFSESYASAVTCVKPWMVVAEASNTQLFKELTNIWQFTPGNQTNSTLVDFFIRFQCHNKIYEQLAHVFFHEWQKEMMHAFIQRAESIYGSPK